MRAFILSAALACVPAYSVAQASQATSAMERLLEQHLRRPGPVADLKSAINVFAQGFELDGQSGLTLHDYTLRSVVERSSVRANDLALFLRYDLNGDGAVTVAEAEPFARLVAASKPADQAAKAIADGITKVMANDVDGDGAVTVAEHNTGAQSAKYRLGNRSTHLWMEIFVRFDTDADGTTTKEEISAVFDATLQTIDTNNDAMLDEQEITAFFAHIKEKGQFKPETKLMPLIEARAKKLDL